MRQAVRELPARHDALRSTFSADGLVVRAGAVPELEVKLHELDEAGLQALATKHVTQPFDLEHGPLVRAGGWTFGRLRRAQPV